MEKTDLSVFTSFDLVFIIFSNNSYYFEELSTINKLLFSAFYALNPARTLGILCSSQILHELRARQQIEANFFSKKCLIYWKENVTEYC